MESEEKKSTSIFFQEVQRRNAMPRASLPQKEITKKLDGISEADKSSIFESTKGDGNDEDIERLKTEIASM